MKWTPVVAMICIAGLEAFALSQGVNGAALSLAVAVVAGLGGYEIRGWRSKK